MNYGRYRLVGQMGSGADGLALRALDGETGQECELRDLAGAQADPERWRQLTRRLRLAALLQHPVRRRLVDMNLEHEPPFIVLNKTDAPPLAEVCHADLPWAPAQVRAFAIQVAGALQEAHRLGLVHGSLGPSTICWQVGEPAQVDFTGTACFAPATGAVEDACRLPSVRGQIVSLDPTDDMFALGVIVSWLLLGRPAPPGWRAHGDREDGGEHTALLTLIESLLRPDPNDRPSAHTLLEALSFGLSATFQPRGDSAASRNGAADFESTRVAHGPLPQALTDTQTTLKVVGRFRLLQLLGEGGLGKVYRAEDITDGSMVAIKVLHPHLSSRPAIVQRFVKEARLLREVHSPFIANILEINEDQGTHYLALDFIDGLSLNDLLKNQSLASRGRLDEAHALALMIDVTRGLADAHRRGIIHRDIKPQNIMVVRASPLMRALSNDSSEVGASAGDAEPGTKLCDFGLARHVMETESLHLTQEGMPVGTPLYMSPEQAAGQAQLGPPTDVYALGVTLYQMLAGRPPFVADSALALSLLHINQPPPPLTQFEPALSDGVCRIVHKCLAKKAEERYSDADALLSDLERLLRGEPASIALHPQLPTGTNVLQYDWSWDLASSPAQLWPFVSNTERLNRAAGVPAVDYRILAQTTGIADEPKSPVRRYGSFRKAGVDNVWREHPFEWVEGQRLGVLREYDKGVFKWLSSTTEVVPKPDGGTTLIMQVRVEPRSFLGRLVAGLEVGFKGRKRLETVYRRIDAYVSGQQGPTQLDPFEEPARLSRAQTRRLEQHLRELLGKNLAADVVGQLVAFLENAPDQEVARIRPLALARRLGVSGDAMVAACLQAARAGLLVLLWDILCPLCRIPAGIVDTLKALKDHAHCEACQADFELDFTKSVEMVFRVHPEVRSCETRTYCAGGPAHSPHVVAQIRVASGERFDLELTLPEGSYRVRGPQLPRAFDFDVAAGAFLTRWSLEIPGDLARTAADRTMAEGTLLRAGQQHLVFHNNHVEELVLRVERTAQREDALTAARAASSALFRELFPGEILESGKLVSVAAVTLLVLDLNGATNLDKPGNLYQTLGEARTFGLLHDYFQIVNEASQREGGALVKTLGETVLVAFESKVAAVRAALLVAQSFPRDIKQRWPNLSQPLQVRAGVHHGPAMSATVNGALDYFGTTVDQALRLPSMVAGDHLILSRALAADRGVVELLRAFKLKPEVLPCSLPGQPVGILVGAPLGASATEAKTTV